MISVRSSISSLGLEKQNCSEAIGQFSEKACMAYVRGMRAIQAKGMNSVEGKTRDRE